MHIVVFVSARLLIGLNKGVVTYLHFTHVYVHPVHVVARVMHDHLLEQTVATC